LIQRENTFSHHSTGFEGKSHSLSFLRLHGQIAGSSGASNRSSFRFLGQIAGLSAANDDSFLRFKSKIPPGAIISVSFGFVGKSQASPGQLMDRLVGISQIIPSHAVVLFVSSRSGTWMGVADV
jgi:hypothetical protein